MKNLMLIPSLIALFAAGTVQATPRGLCERSANFQEAAIMWFHARSCEKVTAAHIAAQKELVLYAYQGTDVSKFSPDDFEGFNSLTFLSIENSGNGILTPELLSGMPSLKKLDLDNFPGMTELPEGLFRNLPELETVKLDDFIGVRSIAPGFLKGPVNLRNFQASGLPLVKELPAGLFQAQPSLERIDLSDSGVPRFQSNLLSGLLKLTKISLSIGNYTPEHVPMPATEMPLDFFRDLPSLGSISLGHLIVRPGTFAGLDGASSLSLYGVEIERGSLTGLRQLKSLSFWGGPLQAGDFQGLENLQTLSIVNSKVGNLPPRVFAELSSLKTLYFSGAGITSFANGEALAGLKSLTLFEMTRNDTGAQLLTPRMFEQSPGLRKIRIRESGLRVLPVGTFRGLPELGLLDIVGHEFVNVDPQVFSPRNLAKSTMVYFAGKTPDRETQYRILAEHGDRIAFDCGDFSLSQGFEFCPI
jgi:Leucine-rich repeat (LRR) protein